METKQTSLIELLERIPQDARLVVEHDRFSSSVHNVGRLAHEAAAALRAALAQQAEPRNQCGETCERAKLCATCAQVLAQQDEPVHEPLTIERLRDALVASRIIDPAAVEDPDGYDDGATLHRIEALHRRLT